MDHRTIVKAKMFKLIKENIRKYFCDNEVGKDFLMKTQKL